MEQQKTFWVKYTGSIEMPRGFDSSSELLRVFVRDLTARCQTHPDLGQSAIMSPGDGRILLTTVVSEATKDRALIKALQAFTECIERVGWRSNLGQSAGDAHELVTAKISDGAGQPEVKELVGTR